MRKSLNLNLFLLLAISLMISCQKHPSGNLIPLQITSDSATRTAYDGVDLDKRDQFAISEALVRQFLEESESSVVIRNIVPYEVDGDVSLYVVNLDKGWRIISSDARTQAVLAKGESGSFDLSFGDNSNIGCWLQDMAERIRAIKRSDKMEVDNSWKRMNRFKRHWRPQADTLHRSSPANTDSIWIVLLQRSDTTETVLNIPHLLNTKWGQDWPWNSHAPTFLPENSYTSTHYSAGCVPTALSQLLYYFHDYLGAPSGLYHTISLQSTYYLFDDNHNIIGEQAIVFRSDYQTNSSRWESMPQDSLSGISNLVGSGYVSDLMLDIGNRLGAVYSGKGAFMTQYVNTGALDLSRCNIEYDWGSYSVAVRDSVFSNLVNSRPVMVMASLTDSEDGHAWVIDGAYHKTTTIRDYVTYRYVPYVPFVEETYSNPPYEVVVDWFISLQEMNWFYPNAPTTPDQITTVLHDRFYRMNWGYNGRYDDGYYSCSPNEDWVAGSDTYSWNKRIYYNLTPSTSFTFNP